MKTFIYYPITPYHIILSSMLREHNKNHDNSIILDESIFAASFINKVSENSNWDNIYVLKKYSRVQNLVYRNILYRSKYSEIFQLKHTNLVFFSFGSSFANTLINSIYENNNMLMGEDGILPYNGLDAVEKNYHRLLSGPKINKLKRLVNYIVNPKIRFNSQSIDGLLLLNPEWLPPEVIQQYEIEQVKLDRRIIRDVFDELTHICGYRSNNIFNDVDVVFFDSDMARTCTTTEQEEFCLMCNVFDQLQDMTVFIKLRGSRNDKISERNERYEFYNALQERTSCNMMIDDSESRHPWEIVFHNNAAALKDVIFMGTGFSTAFLAPKKFFDSENDIIYLRNVLSTKRIDTTHTTSIGDLIGRIGKSYLSKNIYVPETFHEIRSIVENLTKSTREIWSSSRVVDEL